MTRVLGSYAAVIQANTGWAGTTAQERFYQSDYFPSTDDYKAKVDMDWDDAVTTGRACGLAVRLTDDGNKCYYVVLYSYRPSDTTMNMPHIKIFRRIGGSDTEIVAQQDVSGTVTGADLNAGVTLQLRVENTDPDTVNLIVNVDKGAGFVQLYSHDDDSAVAIFKYGTVGIYLHANSDNGDVAVDNLICENFEDEAPDTEYQTGIGLIINGTYYSESQIETLGLQSIQASRSYAIRAVGQITDINDIRAPALSLGDDVSILWNDTYLATGVVRPRISEGNSPEGITYTLHGAKLLAQGVPVTNPTNNQGQILFNGDSEDPNYDSSLDNMSIGDILEVLFDNHLEGEDGLRAHKAAPPSGTAYTIPAGLTNGPIIPGLTVSGMFPEAVEYLLARMPEYGWDVDPETLAHTFHARSSMSKTAIDTQDEHTKVRIEEHPEHNRTVVLIRGGEPEIEWATVSLGDGTLAVGWDTTFEGTWDLKKSKVKRVEGTIANFGIDGNGRVYVEPDQTGGLFPLVADEWNGTFLTIIDGDAAGTYNVYDTSATRITATQTAWIGGPPSALDNIAVFGSTNPAASDASNNAHTDVYTKFELAGAYSGKQVAFGKCFEVFLKTPIPGGQDDEYEVIRVSARVTPTGFVLDTPAMLPIGLVNYTGSRNGDNCVPGKAEGVGQNIGDIEANLPIVQAAVPLMRRPAIGHDGTAYELADVRTVLAIDDQNYQYPSEQDSDYEAYADELLKVYAALSVMCEVTLTDVIDTGWAALNKRATLTDSETDGIIGYDASDDLWLAEVVYDLSQRSTSLRIGSQVSFKGIDIQAQRQRYTETSQIKQFRERVKRAAELINCLKSGADANNGGGTPISSNQCASLISSGQGTGSSIADEVDWTEVFCHFTSGSIGAVCSGECAGDPAPVANPSALQTNAGDFSNVNNIVEWFPAEKIATLGANEYTPAQVLCCVLTHIEQLWAWQYQLAKALNDGFNVIHGDFMQIFGFITTLAANDVQLLACIDALNTCMTLKQNAVAQAPCWTTRPCSITTSFSYAGPCDDYCPENAPAVNCVA
jgi:hypothetical protein